VGEAVSDISTLTFHRNYHDNHICLVNCCHRNACSVLCVGDCLVSGTIVITMVTISA
jgi:hypothetical protein